MADTKTFSFDEKAFNEKIAKLEAAKAAVAGKKNYNPFLWYGLVVAPLQNRFIKGERTKELYDGLMSVSETVPPIKPIEPVAEVATSPIAANPGPATQAVVQEAKPAETVKSSQPIVNPVIKPASK